ncbi:MAG: enoyl-CoA hydratase/isomerase family protein, partial [Haliea sp.]
AGPRAFCSGADLREGKPRRSAVEARVLPSRAEWMDVFDGLRKPVIAAVHGFCLGGGLEIALACDIRIASSDATFALPETGLGLIPGGGGTQRLPRLIGVGAALQLMMTGERIDAAEALRVGLVTRVLPDAEALAAEALRLARLIALRPPLAIRFVRQAVQDGLALDMRRGIQLERDIFGLLAATEDSQEAAAAFREKRAPVFTGR